jgi:hypothetical protein
MSLETVGPEPGEATAYPSEPRQEDYTLTPEPVLDRILAALNLQNELLNKLVEAANSHTGSLDWLTTNTAGLFNGFNQMQEAGGISALLPALMSGKGK